MEQHSPVHKNLTVRPRIAATLLTATFAVLALLAPGLGGCGAKNTYNPDLRRPNASPSPTPSTSPTPTPTPGPGEVGITVSPTPATTTTGGTLNFTAAVVGTANTAVTWSVQGGDGNGTITQSGVYTAPGNPGTYTVVATSQADSTKQGTVVITVTQTSTGEQVLGYAYLIGASGPNGNQISQVKIKPNGIPEFISQQTLHVGDFPGGILIDPRKRFVYAFDYPTRKVVGFRIQADHSLTPLSPPSYDTPDVPTAFAISPDGRFLFVSVYEDHLNGIQTYSIGEDGSLTPGAVVNLSELQFDMPGGLVVHPSGNFLYVTGREFSGGSPQGLIGQFRIGGDGTLTPMSPFTVSAPPESGKIIIHPTGKSVYTINASYNRNGFTIPSAPAIAQYRVNGDGTLAPLTPATLPAARPTGLAIHSSGNFLYVSESSTRFLGDGDAQQFAIGGDGTLTPLSPNPTPVTGYASMVLVEPSGQFAFISEGLHETFLIMRSNQDGTLTGISGVDLGLVRQIFDGAITGP